MSLVQFKADKGPDSNESSSSASGPLDRKIVIDNRFFIDFLLANSSKVCTTETHCCAWVNTLGKDDMTIILEKRPCDCFKLTVIIHGTSSLG